MPLSSPAGSWIPPPTTTYTICLGDDIGPSLVPARPQSCNESTTSVKYKRPSKQQDVYVKGGSTTGEGRLALRGRSSPRFVFGRLRGRCLGREQFLESVGRCGPQASVPLAASANHARLGRVRGSRTFFFVESDFECAHLVLPHGFLTIRTTEHVQLDVLEPDAVSRALAEPGWGLRLTRDWVGTMSVPGREGFVTCSGQGVWRAESPGRGEGGVYQRRSKQDTV